MGTEEIRIMKKDRGNMDQIYEKRKETVYALMCDPHYVPMKIREIAILMQVDKENRPELEQILEELQQEGRIELSKRGKYRRTDRVLLTGIFVGNPRGFGFVEIEGRKEDLFISEENMGGALHHDMVEVEILPGCSGKRQEGRITKILSHEVKEVVGTFEQSRNYGFVVPDNPKITKDIFIPLECFAGARDGCKVVAELTDYGSETKNPEGKIIKILGQQSDPGVDVLSIVYAHEIPSEFPERVLNQAERLAKPVSEADMVGREDLRGLTIVTIDGEDAKDLDDGVSLSREENTWIWHLGVHIADVTNYVQERSALDREALRRGTSVYLADRVIPMLPRALSNGICSLNEGEDRLALSCLMDIDSKGNLISHRIVESVIRVNRRMTYTGVNRIVSLKEETEREKYRELVPMLEEMNRLALVLRKNRKKRGSIDFDFPETKIILDENGTPLEIRPYERNAATDMIEDFMLLANETVAEDYYWRESPFVYRTHDAPDPDKIRQLAELLAGFGYGMKGIRNEVHPAEIQKLLSRIQNAPEEAMISRLVLRSMKQAKYTVECSGHFGLAARYYCHFTSPIRRYPDLQIHRIIKDHLRGRMNPERVSHYEALLPEVAQQSSLTERRADEAERETEKMKKAEYMQRHIGETFEGVISGMNQYGFYVELQNTVEGMVHVSNLYDDRYYYDEENWIMYGRDTGKIYRMGQWVKVRVLGADKERRIIDFCIEE